MEFTIHSYDMNCEYNFRSDTLSSLYHALYNENYQPLSNTKQMYISLIIPSIYVEVIVMHDV